jgi:hypothetical protein
VLRTCTALAMLANYHPALRMAGILRVSVYWAGNHRAMMSTHPIYLLGRHLLALVLSVFFRSLAASGSPHLLDDAVL